MTNSNISAIMAFDTELSVSAPFTGTAQLLGSITNNPVIAFLSNQSTVPVFLADNSGSTKGKTMVAGETIVLDCRTNHGIASNMTFPTATSFYVTGTGGTGSFKLSYLYAT